MDIIIGSARHDENGKLTCGRAGDGKQKSTPDFSGEVSMHKFYVHKKGWIIIRPKSRKTAKAIANAMKTACNNPHIGYDQNERLGVVSRGVNTKVNTEADCSSLVRACVIAATGKDPGNFTTYNASTVLAATGLFYDKTEYKSGVKIMTGDIICTKTKGHIVVCVTGEEPYNQTKKWTGKVTASELNVRDGAGTENDILFVLKKGVKVAVCDSDYDKNLFKWYYIKADGKYGFVSSKYIEKV